MYFVDNIFLVIKCFRLRQKEKACRQSVPEKGGAIRIKREKQRKKKSKNVNVIMEEKTKECKRKKR